MKNCFNDDKILDDILTYVETVRNTQAVSFVRIIDAIKFRI